MLRTLSCRRSQCPFLLVCSERSYEASDPDRFARVCLEKTDRADVTVFFNFKFAWGELPTPQNLASFLAARSDQGQGDHWSDYILRRGRGGRALGLIEFCKLYDEVELWFDPTPSDQLQLIWLLDFFSSDPDIDPS
ncbi:MULTISPECIES: hypothetical protein [unclassified Bradyrhizobium]|uniref:hypothetical protein n=1 Tax=unclassified Bradyrhizobium TaxID=2631580 RepID=UPI001FEF3745|nr:MULTISPECIES: hypothetical protein [unclassified Bradyrhizobium]